MAEINEGWKGWEGRVVCGRYCLREYLGGGEASAVFLTEHGGRKAAIKLVRVEPEAAGEQLARWERAAKLSHPNLARLFGMGRAEPGVLCVVMEYAEQALAEVVPERRLTDEEAREMLDPVLSALSYLHGQGLAHGRIKASNVMSAGGGLKLSSDGICATAPAADVRGLRALLAEALEPSSPMVAVAMAEIEDRLAGKPEGPARRKKPYFVAAVAGAAVLAVVAAAPRYFGRGGEAVQAPARPAAGERTPAAAVSGAVTERVLPDVPAKARNTIRGAVRVAVRVQVDATGAVSGAKIESAGPSRYLAKLALDAARRWKFAPVAGEWVLRFTIEKGGTEAAAVRRD